MKTLTELAQDYLTVRNAMPEPLTALKADGFTISYHAGEGWLMRTYGSEDVAKPIPRPTPEEALADAIRAEAKINQEIASRARDELRRHEAGMRETEAVLASVGGAEA